jgi:hypothetical protein
VGNKTEQPIDRSERVGSSRLGCESRQQRKLIEPLVLALMAALSMVACNPFSDEGVNLTAALSGEEAVCEGGTCG